MMSLSLRCMGRMHATLRASTLWSLSQRCMHHDPTRCMIGDREIVGYGINGSPIYVDCAAFPFPAIRYREVTPEICALREKELSDWKTLSLQEKKALYRHSFCQTYSEFQHLTPDWKLVIGMSIWAVVLAIAFTMFEQALVYDPLPDTFDEERRQAQLRRIIHLEMQPITGLSSKWCYHSNKWK
ncbi:cytochrome c oxidase subunit 4 isoform 1, mitochondrial [Drosophila busckii]|uniref:cytochrome c oxidase subunit 4 isoform 1, mitochondrial n=1 Tax=Drosophila busckii TaxID=30019 RepID=UPI0014329148|nr:cytochrome c oxidase subunit 4 isoform 1, mitochondrial [Drosophila busckii]